MNIVSANSRAGQVIDRVRIFDVWPAIGGGEIRHGRGRAFWRNGDGWSISLDNCKGTWYDFVTAEGGGIVDLVALVRGGSRQDALRWLADFAGVELGDSPADPKQRAEWARERKAYERDLREAKYWARGAVLLIESDLAIEKSKLFDPTAGQPDFALIDAYEAILARVRGVGDLTLLEEFRAFREADSRTAAAFIRWAKAREQADIRALERWFQSSEEMAA
jgi:hypothetical protein